MNFTHFTSLSFVFTILFLFAMTCRGDPGSQSSVQRGDKNPPPGAGQSAQAEKFEITRTEAEWRKILTPSQYRILREQGTEGPFTGKYNSFKSKGTFVCAACKLELFSSDHKYDSGTGWPSFWQPIAKSRVGQHVDRSYGMVRTEVHCARCGGHLGHIFRDGPPPTGLRYCINSLSLGFKPRP